LDNFVTLKTFTYVSETIIIRGRLEAEGIECFVQDELTVQVDPFYSNALGGVKLKVRESQLEEALEILKESGYASDGDTRPTRLYTFFDNATSHLGLIGKLDPPLRAVVLVGIFTTLIITIIYFTSRPTVSERLTQNHWCLDRVDFNGNIYVPNTTETFRVLIKGKELCAESIDFRDNGQIRLPGFNSNAVYGNWKLVGHTIQIMRTDTFDFIYNGTYDMNLTDRGLVLKTSGTTLYCHND
jgi:hypothetical protein